MFPHIHRHLKFMIVSSDITQDGDLLCIELLPETSLNFQLIITLIWAVVAISLLSWNYRIKRLTGGVFNDIQIMQPLFMVYPALKLGQSLCILIMMRLCYVKAYSDLVGTLARYLLMAQLTCQTLLYTVFYGFQLLCVCGFGTVSFEVTRSQAKCTLLFTVLSYVIDSTFLMTNDGSVLNALIKYLIIALQALFLFQTSKQGAQSLKTIKANQAYIKEMDEANRAQD